MTTRTSKSTGKKGAHGAANSSVIRRASRLAADIRRAEAAGLDFRGQQMWVQVSSLFSDPRYQRPVDQRQVERMAAEFNPNALGVIYISDRGNGTFAILDGGHRVALMRYIGWDDQKMPALAFTGLTVEEEAQIFTIMNKDRRQPSRIALFHAQVTAGDKDAVALNEVLIECGAIVMSGPGPDHLQAVGAADKVIKITGPDIVRRTLRILMRAWPQHDDALSGTVLSGLALLLFSEERIDDKHMTTRLADFTPGMIINKAKVTKDVSPDLTMPGAVANVLTTVYNTRRRTGRLPQFMYQGWPRRTANGLLYGAGWSETNTIGDDDATTESDD